MFLDFNVLSHTFNESVGEVRDIIEVRKRDPSLETEVDIPIQVLALSGTADAGIIITRVHMCIHMYMPCCSVYIN